jgi:hypothetical protein
MHFHWMSKGSISTILLLSAVLAAWSDEVPVLDLNPICRGIAQQAQEPRPFSRWYRQEPSFLDCGGPFFQKFFVPFFLWSFG